MIIRKRPIISWLLDTSKIYETMKFGVPLIDNKEHHDYLWSGIDHLMDVSRTYKPNWGIPEIIMSSFSKVMEKSAKSFITIYHSLFQEFCNEGACGILVSTDGGTIVYGFGEKGLYIWLFRENNGFSSLYLYFYVEYIKEDNPSICILPTLIEDNQLFSGDKSYRENVCQKLVNRIIIYLAVKKYVKVETIVIPTGTTIRMDNVIPEYKFKDKIKNESGQKVIVMDSRWFRKIVNDNNIFVRGFFRFQNKKNERGEWYKELIFVDSYVRNGYHRNALIEKEG